MRFAVGTVVVSANPDVKWFGYLNGSSVPYVLKRERKRWSIVYDDGRVESYNWHHPIHHVDADVAGMIKRGSWKIGFRPARVATGYRYYRSENGMYYRVNRRNKKIDCRRYAPDWHPSVYDGGPVKEMVKARKAKPVKVSEIVFETV